MFFISSHVGKQVKREIKGTSNHADPMSSHAYTRWSYTSFMWRSLIRNERRRLLEVAGATTNAEKFSLKHTSPSPTRTHQIFVPSTSPVGLRPGGKRPPHSWMLLFTTLASNTHRWLMMDCISAAAGGLPSDGDFHRLQSATAGTSETTTGQYRVIFAAALQETYSGGQYVLLAWDHWEPCLHVRLCKENEFSEIWSSAT